MKNSRVVQNMISSAAIYGLLLVFSIVTSRYILVGYGSETNGLLSSVGQIMNYIALLEAGIGTATVTALYKPLGSDDKSSISDVLAASKQYYRTSARWYFVCVLVMSVVWPFVIQTSIPKPIVGGVIFFQGISGVVTFYYTSTIVNYLVASGRNYVNNNVHAVATIGTYFLKLIICLVQGNIIWISISMVGINVLKCLVYRHHMRKYCPEFFQSRSINLSLLKQRNSFLVHEISGVIFSSTDTIILSVFCSLQEASVYAVYSMVLMALRSIIGQVFNGTNYVLGKAYTNEKSNYQKTHDTYNRIYITCVFVVFTVAYLLLPPFISLYTNGVTDADYLDPKLPLLFVLIEVLSSCRIVDNQLIKIAQHAKQTINRTIIESSINLVCSLILVQFLGIYGVLLGTIIALVYRSNDVIWYANKRILNRKPWREYAIYIANGAVFALIAVLCRAAYFDVAGYVQLIGFACIVFIGVSLSYVLANGILFWADKNYLSKKG